ncbi:unnamed protein product [Didymodactylos carnosus]|uniref:Uncharacterized protein n=1 Tax=Didymodactylos carnosus TaxID=1234261 RepID=A0A815HZE6_9BILA|nr:unnamed protein product [Didymodactylos carnosus]CAF4239155.1 unnamed protein product [Didymodactylos carnosus]
MISTRDLALQIYVKEKSCDAHDIAYADETKLHIKFYDQIWSPEDLNPDRLTSEISKMFIYNETETKRHSYSVNYFDLNKTHAQTANVASSVAASVAINILWGAGSGNGAGSSSSSSSSSSLDNLATTSQSIFLATDIQYMLSQESVETEWAGEKFKLKSFGVSTKLTSID